MIRKAAVDDIPVIAEIERECFSSPWSEESIRSSFNNSSNRFLIIESDGVIAGYIALLVSIDTIDILNIAVLPEYRRQGIAKALLNFVINEYKNEFSFITLEVRPTNTAAIKLYNGFGFERVGLRKDYYRNPREDAWLLTKYFN